MSDSEQSAQTIELLSIMGHVSIGTNQFEKTVAFYDQVLATIGALRILEVGDFAVAWGKQFPEFWVQKPRSGKPAESGNGIHFAFLAASVAMVDNFLHCGYRQRRN
ncbi:MAG: catechol 2,3-dioxygenase-like lactoylglutathione lyase family enzyme [Pseudohongiellaceae bacterium]|jgi:catechol 2,3-dioxygenase-like lactoylglutathione lyase family enzyme